MNLPTKQQLDNAWPFTAGKVDVKKLGPEVMDGEREPARRPVFNVGERVIAPGTPGFDDKVYRSGGPGVVVAISPGAIGSDTFVYVQLDGCALEAQPYHLHELQHEPTI